MEGSDCTDDPPQSAAAELAAAEKIILRWDPAHSPSPNGMVFDGPDRAEAELYLRAVDVIRRPGTIQIAMVRLEDEFRHILASRANPLEINSILDLNSLSLPRSSSGELETELPEAVGEDESLDTPSYSFTSDIREIDIFPSDAIQDLRSIAHRMISAGYIGECFHAFSTVRKSAMEICFRQLGIERVSIGDVDRLEWEALESKFRRWIRGARVCVRFLFPSERRLCDLIFDTLAGDDSPFVETVKSAAVQLLSFVDAVSIIRRAPEMLFKFLDLHDALTELLPDFAIIFQSSAFQSINTQASDIIARLAEAVRGILSDFESSILSERSKIPVPGGTIHPLTIYVMNYTSLISDHRKTLLHLILSNPLSGVDSNFEVDFPEPAKQSPLASHLFWILSLLQFSIENKSQLYKDPALSHLFLMNNLHHIVQKVKASPVLHEMIGDDYLKKLTAKYRQLATSYERSTWMKILNFFRDEGLYAGGSFTSSVSKSILRDRFKSFNGGFEEVHRTQARWLVPDPRLREELRISISAKLLPAYRSFLGRFRHHIESGRRSEKYIKYSVEDLEMALSDFFEGRSPPSLGSRKSR